MPTPKASFSTAATTFKAVGEKEEWVKYLKKEIVKNSSSCVVDWFYMDWLILYVVGISGAKQNPPLFIEMEYHDKSKSPQEIKKEIEEILSSSKMELNEDEFLTNEEFESFQNSMFKDIQSLISSTKRRGNVFVRMEIGKNKRGVKVYMVDKNDQEILSKTNTPIAKLYLTKSRKKILNFQCAQLANTAATNSKGVFLMGLRAKRMGKAEEAPKEIGDMKKKT